MVNGERWEAAAEDGSDYVADADVVRVQIANAEGVAVTFRTFS